MSEEKKRDERLRAAATAYLRAEHRMVEAVQKQMDLKEELLNAMEQEKAPTLVLQNFTLELEQSRSLKVNRAGAPTLHEDWEG